MQTIIAAICALIAYNIFLKIFVFSYMKITNQDILNDLENDFGFGMMAFLFQVINIFVTSPLVFFFSFKKSERIFK